MNKIKQFLNEYGIFIMVILMMALMIETCGIKNNQRKLDKIQDTNMRHIDSALQTKVTTTDFEKVIKRNRLEMCRDILYDQNDIVRQIQRPDDRMKFYDTQLDSLRTGK